jgi:hypothetical protein
VRPSRIGWIISSAAASAAALVVVPSVLAHGDETVFVAEPAVVAPGDGLGVRADLLASGPIELSLIGADGTRIVVDVVQETEEGHFERFVTVPPDLSAGHWTLVATTEGAPIASTTLEVAGGAAGADGGGQGPRDDDDGLLAPLASDWRASRSGAPAAPPSGAAGAEARVASSAVDLVPVVSFAVAIGALTLLAGRARGRAPTRGDPSGR